MPGTEGEAGSGDSSVLAAGPVDSSVLEADPADSSVLEAGPWDSSVLEAGLGDSPVQGVCLVPGAAPAAVAHTQAGEAPDAAAADRTRGEAGHPGDYRGDDPVREEEVLCCNPGVVGHTPVGLPHRTPSRRQRRQQSALGKCQCINMTKL